MFYLRSRGTANMSILRIRNLYAKILAPILLSPKKRREEKDGRVTIRRRVEVIVERETISLIVQCQPQAPADRTVTKNDFGMSRLELHEPQLPGEAADSSQTEPPKQH